MAEILVVDDELGIRNVLSEVLADAGYYVSLAASAQEARELVRSRPFELILLDIWMPGTDGITLLKEWKSRDEINCPIVMMSGHASIEAAMQAVRDGAADFLEKPISLKRLLKTIESVIARWKRDEYLKRTGKPRMVTADPSGPTTMPVFEIPEYSLTLDFNLPHKEAMLAFERAYFTSLLICHNNSVTAVAKHAAMERTHLYRKVRALGIDLEAMRTPQLDENGEIIPDERRAMLNALASQGPHRVEAKEK